MSDTPVRYFYEQTAFRLHAPDQVSQWLSGAAQDEGLTIRQINYIFCPDDYLLEINRKYLNHDYYTDIITFPLSPKNHPLEADIFISIDRVKENAATLHVNFHTELRRVMIHGLLHLAGYDDHDPEQQKRMRAREDHYISKYTIMIKHKTTFDSFVEMYESTVIPLQQKHPDWIRLDGARAGGNRKVFARFLYRGRRWKIHSDTHISKLTQVYQAFRNNEDPLEIALTSKKKPQAETQIRT